MTTSKILVSILALFAASTAFAQTSDSCTWFPKGDEDGQGILGKRYAEAGLQFENMRHTSHSVYGGGINANVPIIQGVEVTGGYDYSTYNLPTWTGESAHIHTHTIGGSVQVFNTIEDGVKPFISFGLYREFRDASGMWNQFVKANRTEWDIGAGVEVPYKWVSIIPSLSYSDDFKKTSESSQALVYRLEVDSWLTRRFGVYANVAFNDVAHSSQDVWTYGGGVRVRF